MDAAGSMSELMNAIIEEQEKRQQHGRGDVDIPMRPDHGHKVLDDFKRDTKPAYPVIGRMKGMAELCGLEQGLRYCKNLKQK